MSNKEIIQWLYQNFTRCDVVAVIAGSLDQIIWAESDGVPLADSNTGHQAMVDDVLMHHGELGKNCAVIVERLVIDGDMLVADGKYTWNHKVNGKPCVVRMPHVWTLADGKAFSFLQHENSAGVRDLTK